MEVRKRQIERVLTVHLAYVDDSGSDIDSPYVVVGAVVVEDKHFGFVEGTHTAAVEQLIPAERLDAFKEFHAYELYSGDGVFKGIDREERLHALRFLLNFADIFDLQFFYAAIDKAKLQQVPLLGSANPVDVAFRQCLMSVDAWAAATKPQSPDAIDPHTTNLCIYVMDDTKDAALKRQLRSSYRLMRKRIHKVTDLIGPQMFCAHDDMYFSDSRDSIGVQIADACCWATLRQLCGRDEEGFFSGELAARARCAQSKERPDLFKCVGV